MGPGLPSQLSIMSFPADEWSESGEFVNVLSSHLYFEVSWEVANKVGGIYTVLRSKSSLTVAQYGGRYVLVGVYDRNADYSFELDECVLENASVQQAVDTLRREGIAVHSGRWLVPGSPQIILFDLAAWMPKCSEFQASLWNHNCISTPPHDHEFNSCIVFGFLVEHFFQVLADSKLFIVAQFHEWLSGVGAIAVRNSQLAIATIFTTHATILGRHLCAGDEDFYNKIKCVNVDEEAGKRGIYHRYCVERAAAHSCHVFTCVSHITAYESEWLLGRKPDGVLPNGLAVNPSGSIERLHQCCKEKLNQFVRYHFYGRLNFSLENVLYFFIAGRYEYRNKGFDLFIEALASLNAKLKHFNSNTTVVAFIVTPGRCSGYGVETLKGQALVQQLRNTVNTIQAKIGHRLFDAAILGTVPKATEILRESEMTLLRRGISAIKRHLPPSVTTHVLQDDANDPVLIGLRSCNLCNWDSDHVKVIYHPEFINATSPILPLEYEEFVRGCHLGVFPSYYEPWGYTPAECVGLGVASITTNLSGFGSFVKDTVPECHQQGVFVLNRNGQSVEATISELTECMFRYCQKSKKQRKQLRKQTALLSTTLDWQKLGTEYEKARRLALYRQYFGQINGQA